MSTPASIRLPRAMSPAMPEKQWNQAKVRGLTARSPRQEAGDGARRAETVVDAHDGDAGSARGQHGEESRDPLEGGAVADAGGHGDDRCGGDAAYQAGQRPLHAGN